MQGGQHRARARLLQIWEGLQAWGWALVLRGPYLVLLLVHNGLPVPTAEGVLEVLLLLPVGTVIQGQAGLAGLAGLVALGHLDSMEEYNTEY